MPMSGGNVSQAELDAAVSAALAARPKSFVRVVHGANATVARPNADYVLWEGSVTPANMANGDDWDEVPA